MDALILARMQFAANITSGSLGIMLVGHGRVGKKAHLRTTVLVGCAITVQAIAMYTLYAYRVCWGKARSLDYA